VEGQLSLGRIRFSCGGVVSCIMSIFLRLGCILAPRLPLLSARFGSGRRLIDSKQYLEIGLCQSQMPFYCAVILACIAP
jgi:hypothetical protein